MHMLSNIVSLNSRLWTSPTVPSRSCSSRPGGTRNWKPNSWRISIIDLPSIDRSMMFGSVQFSCVSVLVTVTNDGRPPCCCCCCWCCRVSASMRGQSVDRPENRRLATVLTGDRSVRQSTHGTSLRLLLLLPRRSICSCWNRKTVPTLHLPTRQAIDAIWSALSDRSLWRLCAPPPEQLFWFFEAIEMKSSSLIGNDYSHDAYLFDPNVHNSTNIL